jgi:putative ABC transport system permease protein
MKGTNGFYETKIFYADSTLFNIFTVKFLEGRASTALTQPNSIVISRTLADKYFGRNTAAVGKTMKTVYDLYKVTGVLNIPTNSHIRYDMLTYEHDPEAGQ